MRLLVIEDEPDLRSAIVQSLAEAGYAVDQAADGSEGLYKAKVWDYDAIVLDLMLSLKNGWEVLGELRKTKGTPVLILSARDAIPDRVRGLDSGADDYLVKPFSIAELLARVRVLVRRGSGFAHSIVIVGPVTVNLTDRTISKENQPVVLTAREFALVELLVLNRGRLITRAKIYDHIFGEDDESLSNLVEVHVSHIRKKLGAEFIETRRGQGYIVH